MLPCVYYSTNEAKTKTENIAVVSFCYSTVCSFHIALIEERGIPFHFVQFTILYFLI